MGTPIGKSMARWDGLKIDAFCMRSETPFTEPYVPESAAVGGIVFHYYYEGDHGEAFLECGNGGIYNVREVAWWVWQGGRVNNRGFHHHA